MAAVIPPCFKPLTPFIRRAEELERDASRPEAKIMAYYCRMYAIETGIKLNKPEGMPFLGSLMERLEADKATLPAGSQDNAKEICQNFALEVFNRADEEDRAGLADKDTAKTFFAAGNFLDVLSQFGAIDADIAGKKKYAKFKALDILKAIKEGRTPTPGAADETVDTHMPDASAASPAQAHLPPSSSSSSSMNIADAIPAAPSDGYSYGVIDNMSQYMNASPASAAAAGTGASSYPQSFDARGSLGAGHSNGPYAASPSQVEQQQQQWHQQPSTPAPAPSPAPTSAASRPAPVPQQRGSTTYKGGRVPPSVLADATEYTRFALSALEHKDVDLAIQRLREALGVLGA